MYRRPIITLHGANGDRVTFDGVGDAFTLKPGTTGTGLPPRDLTHLDLPSGGAVLQHKRWKTRTMLFPLDVHTGAYGLLEEQRRRVEALVASGPTEIEIFSELTGSRFITAEYTTGLEGDFAWAKKITSQPMAIEFEAADPFFYGPQVDQVFELTGVRKPFITGVADDAVRYNLARNPGGEQDTPLWWTFGDADAQTVEFDADVRLSGTRSVCVTSSGGSGTPHVLTPATSPVPQSRDTDRGGEATADRHTVTFAASMRATAGVTHVRISAWQYNGRVWRSVSSSTRHQLEGGWQRFEHTATGLGTGDIAFQVQLLRSVGGQLRDVPPGEKLWVDNTIIEPGTTTREYFDGDFTGPGRSYEWVDGAGSASMERAVATTGHVPFFPVVLSSSTVEGERTIVITGDEPVHAIATITGPGTDPVISSGDEKIRISGEVREPITIDSRPNHYDVHTTTGDLWHRTEGEPSVLHLKPGTNRVRMSMVSATPQSSITLSYRPKFHAGH